MLAAAGRASGLILLDLATGRPAPRQYGPRRNIYAVLAVPTTQGRTLLAVMGDRPLPMWDPVRGMETGQPVYTPGRINGWAAVRLPDGRVALTEVHHDRNRFGLRILDETPEGSFIDLHRTTFLVDHTGLVRAAAEVELPDGGILVASAGDDATVRLWDPVNGEAVAQPMSGHRGSIRTLTVARVNGSVLLISAGLDGTVRLWDPVSSTSVYVIDIGYPVFAATALPPWERKSGPLRGAMVAVGISVGILILHLDASLFRR